MDAEQMESADRTSEIQRSLELFACVRDLAQAQDARDAGFVAMILMGRGWWHDRVPLLVHVLALAKLITRNKLPGRFSVDRVDWESIGVQALLEIRNVSESAQPIRNPRSWLYGVVCKLVQEELRSQWHLIAARPSVEAVDVPADFSAARQAEPMERCGLRDAALSRLRGAIAELPPSLRVTAELLLIDRESRPMVCQILGITPALLRKRIERILGFLKDQQVIGGAEKSETA
jgi:DNA-directed RNA polymerase specialized sigma24 family protein